MAAAGLAAAVAVGLVACDSFGGPPSYTLSESDLQRLAAKRFPIERRLLDVIVVSLATPEFHLLPDRGRVATSFEIDARDRLLGGHWQGRLSLTSALRYAPEDHTLRLAQVEVDRFDAEGSASAQAERIVSLLAERLLEGLVIYRLPDDKLSRMQSLGYEPGTINVTPRGLVITAVAVKH